MVSPGVPLDRLVAHLHDTSGETHLLSEATDRLLGALDDDARTLDELAAATGLARATVAAGLLDLLDAGLALDG